MDVTTVSSMPVTTPAATIKQGGGSSRAVQDAAPSVPAASGEQALPKAANSAPPVAREAPSPEDIAKGIKQLNDVFTNKGVGLYASYEKDKITGIEVVQLKDKNTNEVIRQIPEKEMLAIAQSIALPQGWRGQLIYNKL